jgi:signal peptidase I
LLSLPSAASVRETVESIIYAFLLAFLIRTFQAEAFVIPTGSMAPTLMGCHKDLHCPKCGYEYQLSASDSPPDAEGAVRQAVVESGTCPMCRYTADLSEANPQRTSYPSYNGDRILVAKFPYQFAEPQRWDVIVFKYPGDATTNYIKRLVGLPGDTIRIHHGDLWLRQPDGTYQIARKPPRKILAMLQPVFDNDLAPTITKGLGWPARWRPLPAAEPRWQTSTDGASFTSDGSADGEAWLRYRHLVPTFEQWEEMEQNQRLRPGETVAPQLISDFTAYNTGQHRPGEAPTALGLHWVGDLALQATLDLRSTAGQIVFELVKGGRQFQCRIDVATGRAVLGIVGAAGFHPAAVTAAHGPGKHKLLFSNIDDDLRLWVDGSVVQFDGPTTYDSFALGARVPREADLSPAGIAARGAAVTVSQVKLFRDIYYIAANDTPRPALTDFINFSPDLADPNTWTAGFAADNMNQVEFVLPAPDANHADKDRFFVLGDNSAQSKDGRLWGREYWVNRELLVGKALLIYWPHSWNKIPYINLFFPYFPNFQRMHLVR